MHHILQMFQFLRSLWLVWIVSSSPLVERWERKMMMRMSWWWWWWGWDDNQSHPLSFTTTNFQNVGPFGPLLEHCISYYESLGIPKILKKLVEIQIKYWVYMKEISAVRYFDVVRQGFQKHLALTALFNLDIRWQQHRGWHGGLCTNGKVRVREVEPDLSR